MEGFFFQLIAFGIVFMMFTTSFGNRYLWFMAGLLFIPDHFPLFNLLSTTSSRFFIFSLLVIFILKNNVSIIQKIKYFPFKYSWSLVLIGFILTSFYSSLHLLLCFCCVSEAEDVHILARRLSAKEVIADVDGEGGTTISTG